MTDTATAQPRAWQRETDWVLARPFVLRTAGMPIGVAERLRFEATAAWSDAVLERQEALAERAQRVQRALETAIAQHEQGSPERAALINLRRDAFNDRVPREGTLEVAERVLAREVLGEVEGWLALREEQRARIADGRDILADEAADRRRFLAELADDDELRAAILLQSPTLFRQLPRHRQRVERGKLDKRARRVERTLLEYVYRAACKTSPFSTLTAVSFGRFTDDEAAGDLPHPSSFAKRAAVRLNVAVLSRLSAVLTASDVARPDLLLRLTSGWVSEPDRVRYVRRRSSFSEDEEAAVSIDSVHENLFYLPTGKVLAEVLEAFGTDPEHRFADLASRLVAADPEGRSPDQVSLYLRHLLRLGLLVVPALQVDIHSPDPLGDYRAQIAGLGRPWAAALADRLGSVEGLVREYPGAAPDDRAALLGRIRDELQGALSELGRGDVAVPRALLYEDTSLPGPVHAHGRAWEAGVAASLRAFAPILALFDINLPRRLVTKGFFRARYGEGGTCDDVATFAHEFQHDFFDPYMQRQMRRRAFDDDDRYVAQENWFKQPEIAAVDEARDAVARGIAQRAEQLPADAEELVLDRAFIDGIAERMPRQSDPLAPWSFFAQLADADEGRRLVLNQTYSGLTLLFSRFAHCFDESDGPVEQRLREALDAVCPQGAVFAELRGGYDATNLNLHPVVTPYELVCPGEASFRSAAEQIPIEDLVIRDDPSEDRLLLWSRRLDCEVIPVYLGFLMPMALPEIQQVLLNFSLTSAAQLDLWRGGGRPLGDLPIVRYPRLRFGDVVLHRQMWKLDPGHFPLRGADQPEHEHFLEVARWRREHGLPRRVFVTPDATAGGAPDDESEERDGAGEGVSRKPLYVDFDSALSVGLLERLARAATSRLVVAEMLPDHEHLWLRDGEDAYVAELTLEVTGISTRSAP